MADRGAVVRGLERIEAGIGAELVGALLDQRNGRDELILVVQRARVEHECAAVEIAGQGGRELAALVGVELRIAHTIRDAIEATDAAIPAFGNLKSVEAIHTLEVLAAVGESEAAFGRRAASPEHEVRRGAGLAIAEHDRWAALHDFDALDRVIEANGRRLLEE